MDITIESVNEKLKKGESLSKEENQFVMSMPPDGEVPAGDKINFEEAEDLDKKKAEEEKQAQEKKEKEDAKKAEDQKKKDEEAKDPFVRIERELLKPEGQEKLDGFTPREKAYFFQMRKDRKKRQEAEEERDRALFREAKSKREPEAKSEADEDPLASLDNQDPDAFLTVKEVKEVLKKALKKPERKEDSSAPVINQLQMTMVKMFDNEARAQYPDDYDAVMELSDIVNSNPEYVKEIGRSLERGDNPALKAYELIKSDAEFSKLYPAAETRAKAKKPEKMPEEKKPEKTAEELKKEQEAQKAQDALEKNKDKAKTTGHAGGESKDEGSGVEGYTQEDIFNMSDIEFSHLPKATRTKILQQYG